LRENSNGNLLIVMIPPISCNNECRLQRKDKQPTVKLNQNKITALDQNNE